MLGMDIGAAIKKLRLERNLTQEELAERANTSKPNISNLERNVQGFSPVILSSLGKAFGLKVSEIFRLAEELGGTEDGSGMQAGEPYAADELIAMIGKLAPRKQAALLRFIREWDSAEEP